MGADAQRGVDVRAACPARATRLLRSRAHEPAQVAGDPTSNRCHHRMCSVETAASQPRITQPRAPTRAGRRLACLTSASSPPMPPRPSSWRHRRRRETHRERRLLHWRHRGRLQSRDRRCRALVRPHASRCASRGNGPPPVHPIGPMRCACRSRPRWPAMWGAHGRGGAGELCVVQVVTSGRCWARSLPLGPAPFVPPARLPDGRPRAAATCGCRGRVVRWVPTHVPQGGRRPSSPMRTPAQAWPSE